MPRNEVEVDFQTYAFDIETIPDPERLAAMPEPDAKLGNLKDPDKIAEKIARAKAKQAEDAALNPESGRVAACGFGYSDGKCDTLLLTRPFDDAAEATLIGAAFAIISRHQLITFNGYAFDLPFLWKRAVILNVDPPLPLSFINRRYSRDKAIDLMQEWVGWQTGQYAKLDTVARLLLGEGKHEFDVTTIAELLTTDDGRKAVAAHNQECVGVTMKLYQRLKGRLF